MKTTQYLRQEKAIASADAGSIRERWLWGLRLLRDPEAMASEKSLKHGVIDQLVAAARSKGLKLSEQEIQRRLRCARAYPTEAEIRHAVTDFDTWRDIVSANFPPNEAGLDDLPADHRTDMERAHDRRRELVDLSDPQLTLPFPLDTFDPPTTTLKELEEYASEMAELTARFVAADDKRREYLEQLVTAACGDLSVTWAAAHALLAGTTASA